MKTAERDRRIAAHYHREIETFGLRPWDVAPVFLDTYEPPAAGDTSERAESWRRARALRDELLQQNPNHYDDLKGAA